MRFRLSPSGAALVVLAGFLAACGDDGGPSSEPRFVLTEIVTANTSTCGLTPGGSVYCWGKPLSDFGFCDKDCQLRPMLVLDSSRVALHRLAGGSYGAVCGLDPLGSPRCGGLLLVDIDAIYRFSDSFDVLPTGSAISALAVGQGHICGIAGGGGIRCWGDHDGARRGDFGPNLGTGTDFVANSVPGGGSFSALSLMFSAGCAVETGSQGILCWGYDSLLGSPTATVDSNPDHCGFYIPCTPIPSQAASTRLFSALASGTAHTCGLEAAGAVYCWGYNYDGQVGNGDTTYAPAPTGVSLPAKVVALAAGGDESCAVLSTGDLYCWGALTGLADIFGAERVTQPTKIAVSPALVSISLSFGYACGLTAVGEAYCWGDNSQGQLGTGDKLSRASPRPVQPPPQRL